MEEEKDGESDHGEKNGRAGWERERVFWEKLERKRERKKRKEGKENFHHHLGQRSLWEILCKIR